MVSRQTARNEAPPGSAQAAVLALLLTPGAGPVSVHRAVAAALAARVPLQTLLTLSTRRLLGALPPGLQDVAAVLARCGEPQRRLASDLVHRVLERGGQALLAPDAGYPTQLNVSLGSHAPPVLFVLGDDGLLHGALAGLVGARKPSERGRQLAASCAEFFVGHGVPVVSGGARGVDRTAHLAALAQGGKTVIVLPQGLLTYRIPGPIRQALAQGRAAIISEFVPDAPWTVHAAVTRNATIAALARVLCVIEPRKTGGSIRTARAALAQGKRVLVYSPQGHGPGPELLASSGVVDLLDSHDRLNATALLESWNAPPQPGQRQGALFDVP